MVVSSIQEISLKAIAAGGNVCMLGSLLAGVMRLLVHSSYSREESTRYTEEWVLSLPWRTEARTDISRLVPRSLFLRVLKDELYKDVLRILYSSLWAVYVQVWDIVEQKLLKNSKETGRFIKISAASLKESHPHDIHITKEAPNYSVDDK